MVNNRWYILVRNFVWQLLYMYCMGYIEIYYTYYMVKQVYRIQCNVSYIYTIYLETEKKICTNYQFIE